MDTSELERRINPWDRALLALYGAEQVARLNASLPLSHTDTDREALRLLAQLRVRLRDATWMSDYDLQEALSGAETSIRRLTGLLNDRVEAEELLEAHLRAVSLLGSALQVQTPNSASLPQEEKQYPPITSVGNALPDLAGVLSQLSSFEARAPKAWWLDAWHSLTAPGQPQVLPRFSLFLDPGDASSDDIKEVLSAINAVHQAAGGSGFIFTVEGDRLVMSPAPQ